MSNRRLKWWERDQLEEELAERHKEDAETGDLDPEEENARMDAYEGQFYGE